MEGKKEGGLGLQNTEMSPLEADKLAEALQTFSIIPPWGPSSSSTSSFPAPSAATTTAATATDEKGSSSSSNKVTEIAPVVQTTNVCATTK